MRDGKYKEIIRRSKVGEGGEKDKETRSLVYP